MDRRVHEIMRAFAKALPPGQERDRLLRMYPPDDFPPLYFPPHLPKPPTNPVPFIDRLHALADRVARARLIQRAYLEGRG
jgi:hypothetical protein